METDVVKIFLPSAKYIEANKLLETSFIKLETNDDCMIGVPNQIKIIGDYIYILDSSTARSLFVFNKEGRFIAKIGRKGSGPGEYLTPFFFNINENINILTIIDTDQQKLITYNLSDYSFVEESRMPFNSTSMEWLSEDRIVWYNSASDFTYLFVTDEKFNVIDKLIKNVFPTGYGFGLTRKIYRQNESVSVYTEWSPIVYDIRNREVGSKYEIIFGKSELPPLDYLKKIGNQNQNFIPQLLESEYVAYFDVFETDAMLCVSYFVDGETFFGFYDKVQNIPYVFTRKQLAKELKIGSFSTPVGSSNTHFISLLNPSILHKNKEDGFIFDDRLLDFIKISSPEDNPILLLCGMDN